MTELSRTEEAILILMVVIFAIFMWTIVWISTETICHEDILCRIVQTIHIAGG